MRTTGTITLGRGRDQQQIFLRYQENGVDLIRGAIGVGEVVFRLKHEQVRELCEALK